MDIKHLVRDATRVHKVLKEVNGSLVTSQPCKIYVPESYMTSELGGIEDMVHVVAIFAIVIEDKYYAVSKACALFHTKPSHMSVVTIDNEKYMEFAYNANDKIFENINLVRTGTLVYRIYNEFIAKGKIPWYFTYSDLSFLFDTALLHGNADLRANSSLLELLATTMARQKQDKSKFFRHSTELKNQHSHSRPWFIPLRFAALQATNTTAKLLGSYFSDSLSSALVNKSENVESIETLLRQ